MSFASQKMLDFGEGPTPQVRQVIERLSKAGDSEERGEVFTHRSVVDSILDLVGYRPEQVLSKLRLLEPSFGTGEFLFRAIERLIDSYFRFGGSCENAAHDLKDCIVGVELLTSNFEETKQSVRKALGDFGLSDLSAIKLADFWLVNDDFLLTPIAGEFDVVVGNPPYVRQERIPKVLISEYRRLFNTLYDRADLYVLFFEKGLDLLKPGGSLGYICSNRWIKNKYGKKLRAKVASDFNLKYYINAEAADLFNREVIAYPAIFVITKEKASTTRIFRPKNVDKSSMAKITEHMARPGSSTAVIDVPNIAKGSDPWLLDDPEVMFVLRRLEHHFPTMEEDGCRVTIGVATGADRVFIGNYQKLPVEPERKLPLIMAPDIRSGAIEWHGKGIVNPFLENGQLAPLQAFPLFEQFIESHEAELRSRHVARKNPSKWYRTIDRIYPNLTSRQKLLIPDIKGHATVVLDSGEYYPHHNLYVVTSEIWDLRALQALLRSSVALAFVATYCVKMSGGFLRFQAQYLRRIRVPRWIELTEPKRHSLIEVAEEADIEKIDKIVFSLFGIDENEGELVQFFAARSRIGAKA